MISLKAIHTSFAPTNHHHHHQFFQKTDFSSIGKNHHPRIFLCRSTNDPPPPSEGDTRKQELLARIAMLQAQKIRLTDYLDERSAYLTQFAEDANAEFDQVGQNALKELDEVSARIMDNIESRMQAFEESSESSKLVLIALVSISIVDSFISPSFDWRKGMVLGIILVGLLTQFTYEQKMLAKAHKMQSHDEKD